MPPTLRIRPYKDFLTPALHRRFTTAAVTLLGVCYVEAILLGQWNSLFWTWFPFGRVGLRTGLLFICAFSIFVLRVAQLHVGLRTTTSTIQTAWLYTFRPQTAQTLLWYGFSAWLFTEVYFYSASKEANIFWITEGKNNDRLRLNERAVYLMCYFLALAAVQTGIHLFYDYDCVDMPVMKTRSGPNTDQQPHVISTPSKRIRAILPTLVTNSLKRASVMATAMPVFYTLIIRQTAWSYFLMFSKLWWKLPKSTLLPSTSPFHWLILMRSLTGGFLLIMMWEVGNAAFSAYVAQEPLKNERPITYESRDPNGSLLTGLQGKKLQTRAFAFWELVVIAERFQGRRKVIYEDIDRKGGSAWSQILTACLATIDGVTFRITEYHNPIIPPAQAAEVPVGLGLPRLTAPLREDDILVPSPKPKATGAAIAYAVGSIVESRARAEGQIPSTPLVLQGRELLKGAAGVVLSSEQEQAITAEGIQKIFKGYTTQFLHSSLGWPIRQDFRRKIAVVVLGSPYGDVGIIVDAVDALTRLCVCSLKEDPYGNVQRDVPAIIRTFTSTISKLEEFKSTLAFHWTDVEKKRESPEVDAILAVLKGSLNELIAAFGDYSEDLRLSQSDMRNARAAAVSITPPAQKTQEMKQR